MGFSHVGTGTLVGRESADMSKLARIIRNCDRDDAKHEPSHKRHSHLFLDDEDSIARLYPQFKDSPHTKQDGSWVVTTRDAITLAPYVTVTGNLPAGFCAVYRSSQSEWEKGIVVVGETTDMQVITPALDAITDNFLEPAVRFGRPQFNVDNIAYLKERCHDAALYIGLAGMGTLATAAVLVPGIREQMQTLFEAAGDKAALGALLTIGTAHWWTQPIMGPIIKRIARKKDEERVAALPEAARSFVYNREAMQQLQRESKLNDQYITLQAMDESLQSEGYNLDMITLRAIQSGDIQGAPGRLPADLPYASILKAKNAADVAIQRKTAYV